MHFGIFIHLFVCMCVCIRLNTPAQASAEEGIGVPGAREQLWATWYGCWDWTHVLWESSKHSWRLSRLFTPCCSFLHRPCFVFTKDQWKMVWTVSVNSVWKPGVTEPFFPRSIFRSKTAFLLTLHQRFPHSCILQQMLLIFVPPHSWLALVSFFLLCVLSANSYANERLSLRGQLPP